MVRLGSGAPGLIEREIGTFNPVFYRNDLSARPLHAQNELERYAGGRALTLPAGNPERHAGR